MEKSKALRTRLQAAINTQKIRMSEANDYINFLKGKQYAKKPKRDEATFNICHTTVQAILNSILRGNSHIYTEPLTSDAVETYQLVEKVINQYWTKLKVKYQLEFTVIDYAGLGLGVSYVDWDFRLNEKGEIISDDPFVLHIPFSDFLIDPEATVEEIYEAKYMIRKYYKSTKELKADSRYKHTKNVTGDKKLAEDISKDKSDDIQRTTLYQIWIPDDSASYVMREGSDDILREVENKFGREYPFVLLQNYKMPGELFPYGEVKILYEPQKILNRIFSLILTHARRVSTRQYAINDLIDITEARKLKDAEDGEILKVEGNARAADVISPIMDAPLSVDVYRAYELINSAIVQLTLISEYRRSSMPREQRKATEAVYIEQGTELSTGSKAEDVAEHCEEIAKKLFTLITAKENIATSEITYKDEKSGQWVSTAYNGSSFPGKYSFRWESGVEAPINQSTRYQKAIALLNTISAITKANPQLMASINWTELLRSTLADSDTKNAEKILTPEIQPGMQPGMTPEQQGMEGGQPQIVGQPVSPERTLKGGY